MILKHNSQNYLITTKDGEELFGTVITHYILEKVHPSEKDSFINEMYIIEDSEHNIIGGTCYSRKRAKESFKRIAEARLDDTLEWL